LEEFYSTEETEGARDQGAVNRSALIKTAPHGNSKSSLKDKLDSKAAGLLQSGGQAA
jgi:hypothetical protein